MKIDPVVQKPGMKLSDLPKEEEKNDKNNSVEEQKIEPKVHERTSAFENIPQPTIP